MKIDVEELKKLPPRERIKKLKELEEQKKKEEEEEKKSKEEMEFLLKNAVREVAVKEEEEIEEELEERKERDEEEKKKKKESLDEIADSEKVEKTDKQEQQDYLAHQNYILNLSRTPAAEIYRNIADLRENIQTKGYMNQKEQYKLQNLGEALSEKTQSHYDASEKTKMLMSSAERALEEMMDPMKRQEMFRRKYI